jgi:hypothetical protein
MKPKLLTLLLVGFIFTATGGKAQNRLLHYWHFNNTLPTTGAGGTHFGTNPMNADYTKWVSKAALRFAKVPNCVKDTGYWDNNLGDSINQRIGYGGCCPAFTATTNNSSIRCRNPNDSMQFLWYIPTKNFKNIVLKWESEASSTTSGPHRMNYDYSLDSGVTYINTNLPRLFDSAGTSWGKITLNLSGISGMNNNNKLIFRLKFGAPNTGSSGNNRFDNITVEGDSITVLGINELNKSQDEYSLYPNPSSEAISLVGPLQYERTISVRNVLGQTLMLLERKPGENDPIDISELNVGIYYVSITSKKDQKTSVLKFVKD